MADELVYFVNGKYLPKSKACISVLDHGLLYGDGVFEGIKVYDGFVYRLDEHLERLYKSARFVHIEIPYTKEELKELILDLLARNCLYEKAYIRLVVTRGIGDLGINPKKCTFGTSVIIITDRIQIYPQELYEQGIKCITCSTRRLSVQTMSVEAKTLNYLSNILGIIEANNAGADEGIMLTVDGYVSEATVDNVFIVKDGQVFTPPTYMGILPGITRAAVMETAVELGIPCEERILTTFDLYTADEVFLTGTAAELVPVVEIDGRVIGEGRPGPIFRRLLEGFRATLSDHGTPIPRREEAVGSELSRDGEEAG